MFTVEAFESHDLLGVLRLASQTLPEEYPYEFYLRMASAQGKYFRVARQIETDRVIGFLMASRDPGLEGRILLFAVDPEFQGIGVGRALIQDAQRSLALDDVRALHLEVRPDNRRAIEFYQNQGFNVSKVEQRVYRDGSDALLMTKPLL